MILSLCLHALLQISSAVLTKLSQSLPVSHHLWEPIHFVMGPSQFVWTTPGLLLHLTVILRIQNLCMCWPLFPPHCVCMHQNASHHLISLFGLFLVKDFSLYRQMCCNISHSTFSPPLSASLPLFEDLPRSSSRSRKDLFLLLCVPFITESVRKLDVVLRDPCHEVSLKICSPLHNISLRSHGAASCLLQRKAPGASSPRLVHPFQQICQICTTSAWCPACFCTPPSRSCSTPRGSHHHAKCEANTTTETRWFPIQWVPILCLCGSLKRFMFFFKQQFTSRTVFLPILGLLKHGYTTLTLSHVAQEVVSCRWFCWCSMTSRIFRVQRLCLRILCLRLS